MSPLRDLREKHYGNKGASPRQVINAEIRAELAGGAEVLELLELLHKIVLRHGERNPDGSPTLAKVMYDRVQAIRDAMDRKVRRDWKIGQGRLEG